MIPLSEALSAAGFVAEELAEWELKREDGRLVYELEADGRDEVEIDARTGERILDD